ncbi:MAG: hypothetical protein ACJASQ_003147 [Crocinitomicaceae bacterium]|jgi:hypothetical protein
MNIFLSWSGEQSKKVAETLKIWLPSVIQSLKPFYSSSDIKKGKRWDSELSKSLNDTEFGIIILTEENRTAPWIMFEAGALAKNIDTGRVCTFLFNIKDTDVIGPLSSFQNTKSTKKDVLKLLEDINETLGVNKISKEVLVRVYEKMWPDLELELKNILDSKKARTKEELRPERELIEESLRILRNMHFRHTVFSSDDFEFDRHDKVLFDKENEAILFYNGEKEVYSIGLNQLTDTAETIDFIFQVAGKGWCKSKHIKEFVDCLNEISDLYFDTSAQGVICPFGSFMKIDWSNRVKTKLVLQDNTE